SITHTPQIRRCEAPALRPARSITGRVPLGGRPSLPHLRRWHRSTVVRQVLGYYAPLRLPDPVRARRAACGLLRPTRDARCGWGWDLPVPVRGVSTRVQGLRLRGVLQRLASDAAAGVAFRLG